MNYAEVIIPLPVSGTFTYAVPGELSAAVCRGCRVYVQFGVRKYYTGIVASLHTNAPKYAVKEIMAVLDEHPATRPPQMKLWEWMSAYYLCSIGEVYRAALPTGLRVESESYLSACGDDNGDRPSDGIKLSERARWVMDELAGGKMRLSELTNRAARQNMRIAHTVSRLLEKGLVTADERAADKYTSKKVTMIGLGVDRSAEDYHEWLHKAFDAVSRSQRQERLLIAFLESTRQPLSSEMDRVELLRRTGEAPSILKALLDKGILVQHTVKVNRYFSVTAGESVELPSLSDAQQAAYTSILCQWKEKETVLLRGITGSGKTEIYCRIIAATLKQGNQALLLVPEISLTTQLTERLKRVFGKRLLVYHSRFSDNERVDIWQRLVQTNEPLVILGVRSAVFLPFARLGVVIVDEEHESSYKQRDPAPRYNGRDCAMMLARMHGAKTLLGSATPSIETYYKALHGRFGLVELTERYSGGGLPSVEVVDMLVQRKKKENQGIISSVLNERLKSSLADGKQAIIFQNRRGYAPSVVCSDCAWTPKCNYCDVNMVYHKSSDTLRCHYCGYASPLPRLCPACGRNTVEKYGYGTERIADDFHERFKGYRVARMDLDTTRAKDSYQDIIDEFAKGDTDILVGTQMVSKGLDFARVEVVGIMNADGMLHQPDFRAHERAFNMMVQVAGRAGRRNSPGHVVIQTTDAAHPLLQYIQSHDYPAYYAYEISEREAFSYPPFTRVIMVYIKHRDQLTAATLAAEYAALLRGVFGNRVLGPAKPAVGRIASYYLQTIMLKVEANASMPKVKSLLHEIYSRMAADARLKNAVVYYDVDPA